MKQKHYPFISFRIPLLITIYSYMWKLWRRNVYVQQDNLGENKVHCKRKSRHKQNARKSNGKIEEKKKDR